MGHEHIPGFDLLPLGAACRCDRGPALKNILAGSFVGLLRALVPAIAGVSRMPYRTFLLCNEIGGTLLAVALVLLACFAGQPNKGLER